MRGKNVKYLCFLAKRSKVLMICFSGRVIYWGMVIRKVCVCTVSANLLCMIKPCRNGEERWNGGSFYARTGFVITEQEGAPAICGRSSKRITTVLSEALRFAACRIKHRYFRWTEAILSGRGSLIRWKYLPWRSLWGRIYREKSYRKLGIRLFRSLIRRMCATSFNAPVCCMISEIRRSGILGRP